MWQRRGNTSFKRQKPPLLSSVTEKQKAEILKCNYLKIVLKCSAWVNALHRRVLMSELIVNLWCNSARNLLTPKLSPHFHFMIILMNASQGFFFTCNENPAQLLLLTLWTPDTVDGRMDGWLPLGGSDVGQPAQCIFCVCQAATCLLPLPLIPYPLLPLLIHYWWVGGTAMMNNN